MYLGRALTCRLVFAHPQRLQVLRQKPRGLAVLPFCMKSAQHLSAPKDTCRTAIEGERSMQPHVSSCTITSRAAGLYVLGCGCRQMGNATQDTCRRIWPSSLTFIRCAQMWAHRPCRGEENETKTRGRGTCCAQVKSVPGALSEHAASQLYAHGDTAPAACALEMVKLKKNPVPEAAINAMTLATTQKAGIMAGVTGTRL